MKILYLFIGLLVCTCIVSAQTFEEKYDTEFNKLKLSSDYLYRDGDTIQWQIMDYNPDFNYIIRVFGYQHRYIIADIPLHTATGSETFDFQKISGTVHLNLMRWMPAEEDGTFGKQAEELCQKYRYITSWGESACDIGKNLDILTVNTNSKALPPDPYIRALIYFTRAETSKINGASFQSITAINKGGIL